MKNPAYIQIDGSIFGDSKIAVLLRKHGAVGFAAYIYVLIQINQSHRDGIMIDDGFSECASVLLDITKADLQRVIESMISLGLLYREDGLCFSRGYMKRTGEYKAANEKRSETQKRNKALEREAKPAAKPQAKPKAEPVPESEEIIRLRGYADAIFAEIPNCKNKPCISGADYQKLIDKWGLTKLTIMQRVYYEWLTTLKDKYKHTDYGVLNVGGNKGWISKAADDELDKGLPAELKRHF